MEDVEQKIVSDEGFINSIRDLGLTTTDAVNELVDNSFDADAKNIWISIEEKNERLRLIVEDDGEGISRESLKKSLAFGGRLSFRRNTTGKFGWGLSSSACCQSPRTEIYSKTKNQKSFYFNYIDLDELKKTSGILPKTVERNPYDIYDLMLNRETDSGTIIVLTHLDRAQWKTKESLSNNLEENLAIVQRKLLANGRNIVINGKKIKFRDPLMLMDGFEGEEESGKGENYAEIPPIVFKNIMDSDGKPAEVKITISKLPIKKIIEKKLGRKFNVGINEQGFYLMRNRRQIAGGQTLRLYTRHPSYNYFRAEISFPPCLDEKFGIQTNKSRFSLDYLLRERIHKEVEKVIAQIGTDILAESQKVRSLLAKGSDQKKPLSEEIADKAAVRLKPSGYKPTKEQEEKDRIELEREKSEKIKEIKTIPDITQDERQKLINQIEIAFQRDRSFQRVIEIIGTGEFYDIRHKGKRLDVIINQAHGFYKKIYEKATQDPILQILLDLFLFTLAAAEDVHFNNKNVRAFYKSQKREWSGIMSTFLEEAESELED